MTATIDLNLVRAFVGVHEAGSFSAAADRLGVPRSTVSRAVSALEDRVGVRLFHRTTRNVTTTASGLELFARVASPLSTIDTSLTDLPDALEAPTGTVRLTTSPDLGTTVVAEAVARYTDRYPAARVEVHLTSTVVDLVRERFDLALRFAAGPLKGAALVALKLGAVRFHLYAAPAYLARRGTPRTLADLANHAIVALPRGPLAATSMPAEAAPACTTCDDKFFVRELLRAGGGIGLLPSYLADADLLAGTLVRVLPRFASTPGAVYLVQPSRKQVPRRVSLLADLLLEHFRQRPLAASP